MRLPILVFALMMCNNGAIAQGINKMAHIQALVSSERNTRSWKTLWLIPGSYKYHYYQWVLEDGSTVTKIETKLIKGIPDQRPLKQSHPNLAILIPAAQVTGSILTPVVVRK